MNSKSIEILHANGLKVTPQRVAVLEALYYLTNHPTAESIKEFVHRNHPNLAMGTIYNTLETFVEKHIVKKIKTDKDFVRYDIITDNHHHLYCNHCDRIENYFDEELDALLKEYFSRKPIPNWEIKDINLQIAGNYKKES
jgi:Fur family peroxide stress response transcriptional regulator